MKWSKNLISLVVAVIFGLSLILVPVVSQVSPVQAAVTWTKSDTAVTLKYPDTLANEKYVEDAWVIKDGATYKMWYTHGKTDLSALGIVNAIIAAIPDTTIIDEIASLALVSFLSELKDLDVTKIKELLDGSSTVIGYATSTNGKTWTVEKSEALADSGAAWNSVGAPCVIKVSDNDYRMWYTRVKTDLTTDNLTTILTNLGLAGERKGALLDLINSTRTVIGYATSGDGITWTVQNPEVLAGRGPAWDSVADPCVIKDDTASASERYKMWYTQGETDVTRDYLDTLDAKTFTIDDLVDILRKTSTVISYTTSTNGITWAAPQEVHTGGTGAWNSVADPSVVKGSSYEMWYTQGKTNLTQANLSSLLNEAAGLVNQFWGILEDFTAGDIEALLNKLAVLDISTIEGLLGNTRTAIGYATSTIGTDWTVVNAQHLVGSTNAAWNSVAAPSVVKDGTTYYMWYTEGIQKDDLAVSDLLPLVLGTDLPIGYATYTPPVVPPEEVWWPVVVPVGVTDVSGFITAQGVFTKTVTAKSFDGLAQLIIDKGTIGLIKGKPLSQISMTKMKVPPAPPTDSRVIGLVYDFGPDGATFEPPITLTITYDPALIPEGVAEQNLVIAMWDAEAGKWVNLVSTVDPETNTITAKVSHFTAFTVLAYTRPAAFATSALTISPTEVDIGQSVTISVLVANIGDLSGSYTVTLTINKVVVATKDVTLAGGASLKVTFTTVKDVAGTYAVNVDGLTGSFTVKPAPPPPVVPPPVVPPPVVPPPVVPPVIPPPINWWLIGGIIAGVIIIGVLIWQVVARRRA